MMMVMVKILKMMMIMCDRKPVHMVYDDPMGDDHHEEGEAPKHCRRKYEVCELLEYEIFHISFGLNSFKYCNNKKHTLTCFWLHY